MSSSKIKVGPLTFMMVKGRELVAGDIITHNGMLKVVNRSYSNENVGHQALDVETPEQDKYGDYISPYRINIPMEEKVFIYRAVKE